MDDHTAQLKIFHSQVKPILASMANLVTLYTYEEWRDVPLGQQSTRLWRNRGMQSLYNAFEMTVKEVYEQHFPPIVP